MRTVKEWEEFEKIFDKVYRFLWINDSDPEMHEIEEGFAEDFDTTKSGVAEFLEAVEDFEEYRQDLVASDREAAAFYIAYNYRFD